MSFSAWLKLWVANSTHCTDDYSHNFIHLASVFSSDYHVLIIHGCSPGLIQYLLTRDCWAGYHRLSIKQRDVDHVIYVCINEKVG